MNKIEKNILYIDSSDYNTATFGLKKLKLVKRSFKIDARQSFKIMEKLEEFLKKAGIKPLPGSVQTNCVSKIYVCKGPGSFTGIRIGVTIAQALSFAWQVPIKPVSKKQIEKLLK